MTTPQTKENWKKILRPYSKPNNAKSWWQVVNTLVPLFALWVLAYRCLEIHYGLSLVISMINGTLFIRAFIILHDCGHGSFFKSERLRTLVGYITGVLTFTPYHQWTDDHATHHRHSGNLSHRGIGDVWTVTVEEYEKMTKLQKFGYRLYRFPFVTFILGPIYIFIIAHRFTYAHDTKKAKQSVYITNALILASIVSISYVIGFKAFLMIQIPITMVSQVLGVYLFYVQHQYEEAYWKPSESWNFIDASLEGSSYFKLPAVLQWASGNIGFHHIHHLNHMIPNYNLEAAFNENELFQNPVTITLSSSIKTIFLCLYDEKEKTLISFRDYKRKYGDAAEEASHELSSESLVGEA